MLSEIQLKSNSIIFLRDLFLDEVEDDDTCTQESFSLGSVVSMSNELQENPNANANPERSGADDIGTGTDTGTDTGTGSSNLQRELPPYIILYLLWRPDTDYSECPRSYVEHIIKPSIDTILHLHKTSDNYNEDSPPPPPPIYLVVDRLTSSQPHDQIGEEYRLAQVEIAEQLIRVIATCQELRSVIEGVTVGLSNDFRAAPGLETCMDAILVGDAERRHFPKKRKQDSSLVRNISRNGQELDPYRSSIGIITEYPDDLTGLDPTGETDAVQNLGLHARSIGNWAGKGNTLNFGARSQKCWRETWDFAQVIEKQALSFDFWTIRNGDDLKNVGNSYSIMGRKRNKGNGREAPTKYLPSQRMRQRTEQNADLMIFFFLSFIATFVWKAYNEQICAAFAMIVEAVNGIVNAVRS